MDQIPLCQILFQIIFQLDFHCDRHKVIHVDIIPITILYQIFHEIILRPNLINKLKVIYRDWIVRPTLRIPFPEDPLGGLLPSKIKILGSFIGFAPPGSLHHDLSDDSFIISFAYIVVIAILSIQVWPDFVEV